MSDVSCLIEFFIESISINLLGWWDDLTAVDLFSDITGGLSVDGAAERSGGSEDFLDSSGELLGLGLEAEGSGNRVDLFQSQVSVVLD